MNALLLILLALQEPRDEKVVIFAREGNDWEKMVASAWDFDVDKPDAGIVRRAEFAKSHWDAMPLFSEPGAASEFVRLQVNDPKGQNGYIVHFYRIDYDSWNVQLLLKTGQVNELGFNDRDVFVSTDQGRRIVDRKTGAIREFESRFQTLWIVDDRTWLIELLDQPDGPSGAFFDVVKGDVTKDRFIVPNEARGGRFRLQLSPDRRFLAYWDHNYSDDPERKNLSEGRRVLTTKLTVHDLRTGEKRAFPFRSFCSPGSGVPVISAGAGVEWLENGAKLTCLTLDGTELKSKPQQVVLDAATLDVVERRDAPPRKPWSSWTVKYLPDRLKPAYESLQDASEEHGRRVALAFLKVHDIDVRKELQYGPGVAFSADGKRMLIWMTGGFYYGDLEADTLRAVPAPPALKNVSMNLRWVSVQR